MVVPQTLRALLVNRVPVTALSRRAIGGASCQGPRTPPPCPPCPPKLPRCRPPHPHPPRAVRIVCCPPRPVKPPPCIPTRCTRTCKDATPQNRCDCVRARDLPRLKLAAGGQDFVAQRLQNAAHSRRVDYEREVASRADVPPPPREVPPAPYALGVERELLRATDGSLHAVPRSCVECPHCSKTGKPSTPAALTLEESDYHCHIGDRHHDPCAHQPRVFLEIDRGPSSSPKDTAIAEDKNRKPVSSTCAPKCDSSAPCIFPPSPPPPVSSCAPTCGSNTPSVFKSSSPSLTAKSSSRGRPSCEASCARSTRSTGRRLGDCGWCRETPSFGDAPQRCRPMTIVERLRVRSSRSAPRGTGSIDRRHIHTHIAKSASAATGGLKEVLRTRDQLAEAGRGRVVSDTCINQTPRKVSPAGKLELNVPPGTQTLRVKVFLDGSNVNECAGGQKKTLNVKATRSTDFCKESKCKSKDSWLSMKNIQEKLTGCPGTKTPTVCEPKCPNARSPPGSSKCPTSFHRTECPRPIQIKCPPRPPKPTKPPSSKSPCKPKVCSSKALLLANIFHPGF